MIVSKNSICHLRVPFTFCSRKKCCELQESRGIPKIQEKFIVIETFLFFSLTGTNNKWTAYKKFLVVGHDNRILRYQTEFKWSSLWLGGKSEAPITGTWKTFQLFSSSFVSSVISGFWVKYDCQDCFHFLMVIFLQAIDIRKSWNFPLQMMFFLIFQKYTKSKRFLYPLVLSFHLFSRFYPLIVYCVSTFLQTQLWRSIW